MNTITAHCLVKNEENFVGYAVKSVVNFVNKVLIFDTGSTDKTVEVIQGLKKEYPDKIIFEEKGECDKKRHTELRQEMVERTTTGWFMILDGDEVWTERGMGEVIKTVAEEKNAGCLIAPFYLCVGDVFHRYYKRGDFEMLGKKDFFSPRVIKKVKGVHWSGDYNNDTLVFSDGQVVFQEENTVFLKNRYWHLTHLKRSSQDDVEFSSYGSRKEKRRETYFVIGREISEKIPEVMGNGGVVSLSKIKSFFNFFVLFFSRLSSPIYLPSWKECGLLMFFLSCYMFFQAFALNGDAFWGYSITEKILHPSFYAANDLVVGSGSGNFLFYKLMAHFPFFKDNFVLRDFILSIPLACLLVLAWYNVFYELVKDKKIVLISVSLLLFADMKLNLHGYEMPLFKLTSIGVIHFLQVFALLFFLQKKYTPSFVLVALTAYIHPGSAVSLLFALGFALLIESIKNRDYRSFLKASSLAILLLIPNLFLFNSQIGGSFSAQQYFAILEKVGITMMVAHAYAEVYFSSGYLYAIGILILVLLNGWKGYFSFRHQEIVKYFIISCFLGSIFWLLNLYFFHNITVFFTLFVSKIFLFVKPIFILFLVLFSRDLFVRRGFFAKFLAVLLLVSLFTLSSLVGFLLILAIILFYFSNPKDGGFDVRDYFSDLLKKFNSKKIFFIPLILVLLSLFGLVFVVRYPNKAEKIYLLFKGENHFNFSFDKSQNYIYSKYCPEYSELINWAKQFEGKMFIVPLMDDNISVSFRYLTKNSIYMNVFELGQLSYNPPAFFAGYQRLSALGFEITDIKKRNGFSVVGYNELDLTYLKKLDADFVIFDKISTGYVERSAKPVFENTRYIVYKLR